MPVALATAIVGASTGIAFTIVSTVISVGLSYLSNRLFTPGGGQDEQPDIDMGILANTKSNSAPVPVIYGYRKVGGSVVYQDCTNNNKDFWMVLVIGEGEIQGIEKIYIDDDELVLNSNAPDNHLTVTDSLDTVQATTIVTGTRYKISALAVVDWSSVGGSATAKVGDVFTATADNTAVQLGALGEAGEVKARYVGKCEFFYKTGSDTQTSITKANFDNDDNFPTSWDTDKRLFGLSYVMCKFTYDRDAFRGIPNISMDVKGTKVPDITGTITSKKWDRNPAAILYDYLTNTTYGRGIDSSLIDLTSFQSAYTHCETALTITGTPPPKSLEAILNEQKLYRLDGVLNVGHNTFDNTKKILSTCRGFLIFSAGKYKMAIDKFESEFSRTNVAGTDQIPNITPYLFNEDNTIGGMDITLGDKSNTYNRARYSFFNPQKNWQYDTIYFDDATVRTNSDRGVVLEQSIRMEFVASRYCAQSIVRQNLRQSRQQIIVGFQTTISALANSVGDIVDISNENAGWELKQFRLLKMELQEDGNVKVVMVEYNPSVYDPAAVGLAFENDAPDTNLPNPFSTYLTPTNLLIEDANISGKSDAGVVIPIGRVKASWATVEDPFVDYYELQYAVLDQTGTTGSSIANGSVYEIMTVVATDWTSLIGGLSTGATDSVSVGDYFKAASTINNLSSLGTVRRVTEDSAGYSTVNVPSTQIDVSGNLVEFIENLSPTTGYAFRSRYVRTNSVQSGYSPVEYFVTAGVTSSVGASYLGIVEVTAGSSQMLNNAGTVTYKAFLLKGGEKSPDFGSTGTEINSYDWFYTSSGGTRVQITNANKAAVTGSTTNNALGGGGANYNHSTITVEADGTALGTTTSGSATFTCEIDYTAA